MRENPSPRAVLALALALVPACTDIDDPPVRIDLVGEIVDEGNARGAALASLGSAELEGTSIEVTLGITATILAAILQSRIAESILAVNLTTSDDDAFELASDIIVTLAESNAELEALVRAEGVAFIPNSTAATIAVDSAAFVSRLRGTPPNDAEFVYLHGAVIRLAESGVLLDQLAIEVGPGAMFDYIADLRRLLDQYLATAIDDLADFYALFLDDD